MGHKVHPTGFRIGIIRDWQAKWYADKHYLEYLQEDIKLRGAIQSGYPDTGIAQVEISRQANEVLVNIHTSRPGVIIGRGGQRVDEMRNRLEQVTGKRVRLNILEVHQPELDATLVAKTVAEQIERRIAYRRAMKQAIARTIQAGAKGIRVRCAGRLGGAEIARCQLLHDGQVPLHTLRADIDYGFTEARTKLGRIGVKVWIYRGDILPEPKVAGPEGAELEAAEPAAEVSEEEEPVAAEPAAEVSEEEEPVAAEPAAEVSEEESAVEIIGDDVTAEESKIPEDS
jgi:small subunit ribosomal protein S3